MQCDRCGRESPEGFRFCGSCGAPLGEAGLLALREERKIISALFCDLVGFTPRTDRMDPEDVHRLQIGYFATVRDALEGYGGTVAKYIGDAVFAVFGAPFAHEDDPLRAVRGALAAVDAVGELNRRGHESDLHVRVGVVTGEALVTFDPDAAHDEGVAWGGLLNTASRIQTAAGADGVLVDEATYRATRGEIVYDEARYIDAKGLPGPVAVRRPRAPRHGDLARAATAARGPLVDRTDELGVLAGALDEVRERRVPRLVSLVGEPGVGKSFVVLEFVRRLDADPGTVTWRVGRSPPYPEGVAFWALSEIVKAQAGIVGTDGAAALARKLRRAVRQAIPARAEAVSVEGHVGALLGLAPGADARGDERDAAFGSWRRFLEGHARRTPLVLVFEDLHWGDDGLLDFVQHLVTWSRDVPLLVVATARPELLGRREGWGGPDALALGPLSERDTRTLVSLAAPTPVAPELGEAVVQHAAGNPLFAVELVAMLAERGMLDAASERLPLPHSLRAIIAARLDLLSTDEKAVVQAAAVVGRSVWPGALAAILQRSRPWIGARLRALEAKDLLVRARRSSLGREPELRFRHALIRDVAYEEIPRRSRATMHRRAAEWIESLSEGRSVDRAELRAGHWSAAYALIPAGDERAWLAERTWRAQVDAGDRALRLHAFPAAARFFRAALELASEDDPERPAVLFRLGKSLYYAETAGADVLVQARDALLEGCDVGTAAEAEAFLALLAHHEGRRDAVSQHCERAAALVAGLGPSRSKAEVFVDLANYLALATERDRALAAGHEALAIARGLGERELEASALSLIGLTRGWSGDPEGREDLRRSIAITEEIGSHLSAHTCALLADLEAQSGDLAACFELHRRARAHAERVGHAGFVRWLEGEAVGEAYFTGAWDEATARADAFLDSVEAGRPHFMEGYCRPMRGRIRLARDEVDGALDDAVRTLRFARDAEDLQMLYPALAFGARAHVAAGARDEGAALAHELIELWQTKAALYPASGWTVDLTCALVALERGDDFTEAAKTVTL